MKKYLTASLCIAIIIVKVTGQANTSLSNLTSPTAINVTLLPGNNNKNLGSAAKSWKNLYVAGNSYVKTAYTYFDDATSQFRINNGADRLVIDDAGKIGIGTIAPERNLDIQTTATTTVMQVKKPWTGSGTTNFNLVEINNAYNFGYGTGLYASGGRTGIKGYAPNGSVTGYGVYGEAFGASGYSYGVYGTASSAGNAYGVVGIASSSGGAGASAFGVYGSASTTNGWAGYFSGRAYFSGNVGLGISNPSVKLHVYSGTDAEPGSGGYIVTGSTSATNLAIDNNEIMARNNGVPSTLYFNDDGGDLVMCYESGNVMIGTKTPAAGYILSVDGKGMFEEIKVQTSGNWPDYVFDENYKLPSLYVLESAIKLNKRLPGIPAAKQVNTEGVLLGDMQTKLLEKIEELTLYIISLQKQIDELKQQQHN